MKIQGGFMKKGLVIWKCQSKTGASPRGHMSHSHTHVHLCARTDLERQLWPGAGRGARAAQTGGAFRWNKVACANPWQLPKYPIIFTTSGMLPALAVLMRGASPPPFFNKRVSFPEKKFLLPRSRSPIGLVSRQFVQFARLEPSPSVLGEDRWEGLAVDVTSYLSNKAAGRT